MRVIGGRLRGRQLATPADNTVRPTSDRVREALFNILEHGIDDFDLGRVHVLDLFAGTGALGIEALSRGAQTATFVENRAASRALIQQNIVELGLGGITTIFRRDATDLGKAREAQTFGLVFADPPYTQGLGEHAIAGAIAGGWLAQGALVIIEEAQKVDIAWPSACEELDVRTWGQTKLAIARFEKPARNSDK